MVSDDEAFIRAIVDRPGDDLPQLVYADWLDERGDPRGEYLRAEVATPGNAARLTPLANGLDPLWAARISRPAAGICCDRVRFRETGPSLSPGDLDVGARRLKCELPTDYRAFILNWNGGRPVPATIDNLVGGFDEESTVDVIRFRSFPPDKALVTGIPYVQVIGWETSHHTLRKYLVVADAESDDPDDLLLLGLSGPQAGTVFYHYGRVRRRFNPDRMVEIGSGWSGLLGRLTDDRLDFILDAMDDLESGLADE